MPPFGGTTNPVPAVVPSKYEPSLDRLFTEAYGVLLEYTSIDSGHVLVKVPTYLGLKVALVLPHQLQIHLSWDGINNIAVLDVATGDQKLKEVEAGFGIRDLLNEIIRQVKPQDPTVPESPIQDVRLLSLWQSNFASNFSIDQLKSLCIALGLDFENVSGDTKPGKAREMALYLARKYEWRRATAYLEANYPRLRWR